MARRNLTGNRGKIVKGKTSDVRCSGTGGGRKKKKNRITKQIGGQMIEKRKKEVGKRRIRLVKKSRREVKEITCTWS